ncbi:Glycerol kinase [Orobanche minor]
MLNLLEPVLWLMLLQREEKAIKRGILTLLQRATLVQSFG